jgi:hypothetical protein
LTFVGSAEGVVFTLDGSLQFSRLTMRDHSASYWFQAGDAVELSTLDVIKAGSNLRERQGVVVQTWKCDVDPGAVAPVSLTAVWRFSKFQGSEQAIDEEGSFFITLPKKGLIKQTDAKEETKVVIKTFSEDSQNCV